MGLYRFLFFLKSLLWFFGYLLPKNSLGAKFGICVGLFTKLGISFSSSSSCEFIIYSLTPESLFSWLIWPKYRVLSEIYHSTLFHRSGQLAAEQWKKRERKIIRIPCPHTAQQGTLFLVSLPKGGISLGYYAPIALREYSCITRACLGSVMGKKRGKSEDFLYNLECIDSIFPLIFCPGFGDHDHYNILGLACPYFKAKR